MNEKYRKYWNSVEAERGKAFNITSKDDLKLLRWLREQTCLERCFRDAMSYSNNHFGGIRGQVLDVGAGVCWSSAIMANLSSVEQVTAIDYSEHRLSLITPIVLEQFGTNPLKVRRIVGDFHLYPFDENSFDVVLFCQSLYMFPDLDSTLKKVFSLLKPGGQLIATCERLSDSPYQLLKSGRIKEFLFASRQLLLEKAGFTKSVIPSDSSGRFSYLDRHYRKSISTAGLVYHYQPLDYALYPNVPVLAGNHFGLKGRE